MTDLRPDAASSSSRQAGSTSLSDVARHAPINSGDRIPTFLLNIQDIAYGSSSTRTRLRIGLVVLGIAVVVAIVLSGVHVVQIVLEELDLFAFLGLFLVNWIGNGGVLVPIPGARFVGFLMIFQHAVILPSWEVFAVGGVAMALGLLSYYIAGARTTRAYQRGDVGQAEALAAESGIFTGVDEGSTGDIALQDTELHQSSLAASDAAEPPDASDQDMTRRSRVKRRVSASWERAVARAEPMVEKVEKHGPWGMFWLCFAPSPLSTAAAFLGGAMGFGFARYLLSSFAAKMLLAGVIVVAALLFADQASKLASQAI